MKKYLILLVLFYGQASLAQTSQFPDTGIPQTYSTETGFWSASAGLLLRKTEEERVERIKGLAKKEALYLSLKEEVEAIIETGVAPNEINNIRVALQKLYHSRPTTDLLDSNIRKIFQNLNKAFPPATAGSAPTLGGQK